MILRFTLCLVLLTVGLCSKAQIDLDLAIRLPNTEVLETASIKKIVEGPYGFMWIATDEGLFRFDGSLLTPIFHGDFEDIDIDEINDRLVFTGRERLILYGYLGHNTRVIPKSEIIEGNFILQTTIVLNDSVYVVGSSYGISILHCKEGLIKSFQLPGLNDRKAEVTTAERDPLNTDNLWFGTKAGLFSYAISTGEYKHHWLKCNQVEDEIALNVLDAVYIHSDGRIFWGSWGGGLAIYDPATGQYENEDLELNRRLHSHVYAIVPESDSIVWVSTTKGAFRYNTLAGKRVAHLASEAIQDPVLDLGPVLIDRMGRFWIGYVNGLRVLDPNKSQIEIIECPLFTNEKFYIISSVSQHKDPQKIYLTVDFSDGLYSYDVINKHWHCYPPLVDKQSAEFRSVDAFWEGDTMWILDRQRIYYFVEGSSRVVELPLKLENQSYRFRSFAKVAKDKIWVISGLAGLYEVRPSKGKITHYSDIPELAGADVLQSVRYMTMDHGGNVWFGLKNQLYLYRINESRFIDISPHVNNGEPFLDIYSLYATANGLYMATKKGVFEIQNLGEDTFNVKLLTSVPAKDIFRTNDDMWLTTGQSITQLDIADGALQQFTRNEGLPRAGRNGYERIDQLEDGRMFLSGRRQFGIFYPEGLEPALQPPVPYFAKVSVDGIERPLSGLGLSLSYITMDPDQNSIAFDFSAISYASQINNRFRYKLEGVNADWTQAGFGSEGPTYTNLSGGNYRFLVEASNSEENWGAPAIIEIEVKEYWWQMLWVRIALTLAAIGILYVVYRIRIQRMHEQNALQMQVVDLERKALQAQMNPHFIFNAMNSIQNLIAKGDERNAMFYLGRFGKLLRSVLDNSNFKFVSLEKELELLKNYILLESLRFEGTFKYKFEIDPSLTYSDVKIPGFIIQPIIENAIQHGLIPRKGDGQLNIRLESKGASVVCSVEDNGVGRVASSKSNKNSDKSSVGLKILESRLTSYHKSGMEYEAIRFEDLFAKDGSPAGTRVVIYLPIQTSEHVTDSYNR